MSIGAMIEIAAGVAMVGLAVWLYRRNRAVDQGYGSQGAVLLLIIAAILLIHGFGGLDYRPSQAELDAMTGQG